VISARTLPPTQEIVWMNFLVASVLGILVGFNHLPDLPSVFAVAAFTAAMRIIVALLSVRLPRIIVYRATSTLVGGLLFLETSWMAINLSEQTFENYYLFPRFKEGYILPTRWHDLVALAMLWIGVVLLLYVSYRLLKYAFRGHTRQLTIQS
jgi:hypothetical protein